MQNDDLILNYANSFKENLLSNIQGGLIICQYDPITATSKAVYISEGWTALTGYSLDELNSYHEGNPHALLFPEDVECANKAYSEQISKGDSYQLEYRLINKNGDVLWVIDRGITSLNAEGFKQNQSIITDISSIKENEEKLRMSEARFRIATQANNATIFEYNIIHNGYVFIENSECIFGTNHKTISATIEKARKSKSDFNFEDLLRLWYHEDDISILLNIYNETLENGIAQCEVRVLNAENSYIWCKIHFTLADDEKGNPTRIIGYMVNSDDQHKQTESLLQAARTDSLTGIYNKNYVKNLVEDTIKGNFYQNYALFVLDIDNFKGVNDSLGHQFGDAVLIDVSLKLRRLFTQNAIVGRIGGDEFLVFLYGEFSKNTIDAQGEALCDTFRHTYSGEKKDYKISCSVGIALCKNGDDFESLFRRADKALYQAKAKGKDQFALFIDEFDESAMIEAGIDQIETTSNKASSRLEIKERIFELLYESVDFSGSVNMILALLGQALGVSHVYIYQNTPDNKLSSCIYQWYDEIFLRESPNKSNIPVAEVDFFSNFDESGVLYMSDTSQLKNPVRKIYESEGSKTIFQSTILSDGVIRGFMGYDSFDRMISFSKSQIDLMVFAAKVIGTFIIKKHADDDVKLYNQNKMEALDSLPSAIYIIDEKYNLHYINDMVTVLMPNTKLGHKCYETFMKEKHPCTNCPAVLCKDSPSSAEIYNSHADIRMITSASTISWSGRKNMRLICCQIINKH